MQNPGLRTLLCVPSKSVESWLTAAILAPDHPLQNGLECNPNVEARLRALPLAQRIKKTQRDYRAHERTLAEAWPLVRQRCTQAERFSAEIEAVAL